MTDGHCIIILVGKESRLRTFPVQSWNLAVKEDKTATVVADDGNDNAIARQKIPYTDLPLISQRLYLVNDGRYRVLMLPSEY